MANQLAFFPERVFDDIQTEGIRYAGSKLKIIPHILRLARMVDAGAVFDGFAGTTRVSQAFAQCGYRVIANDVAAWSEVFATCYLLNRRPRRAYDGLIEHLNAVRPEDGWFTEQYGGRPNNGVSVQKDGLKKPWQIHNTRKLDAIRQEIDDLDLDPVAMAVALTSLIMALDQVDNTLGHYASYLRQWSERSYKPLKLKTPNIFVNEKRNAVFRNDIFDIASDIVADIAYLDPPYGSNNSKAPSSRVRYAAYYHIWKSICLFDKPDVFGKAKRRQDTSDASGYSVFEDFRENSAGRYLAVDAINALLRQVQARWIILSYSSGGRATVRELRAALNDNGRIVNALAIDHKRNVMSNLTWTNEWASKCKTPNTEWLFMLEKR